MPLTELLSSAKSHRFDQPLLPKRFRHRFRLDGISLLLGFIAGLSLSLALPISTSFAQDPALVECIKQQVDQGVDPDAALAECKQILSDPPPAPLEPPPTLPPASGNPTLPPVSPRRSPGEILPNGAVYLGNVFGFEANTDDLKRAIGDLPLLDNMQSFPDYQRMVNLINGYPEDVKAEAREVIRKALAGELDGPMPNNTRWVLQRFLAFKTYGTVVI